MTLTGGCNCGAVRFEVTGDPLGAAYCHCTRCQRRSGTAASPSVFVEDEQFRLVAGEDVIKAWEPGDGGAKWFCPECGSPIHASSLARPGVVAVRFGVFDEAPPVKPQVRIFTNYAAPWEPIPDDGLQRFPEALTMS
jgi:hypothetical protein